MAAAAEPRGILNPPPQQTPTLNVIITDIKQRGMKGSHAGFSAFLSLIKNIQKKDIVWVKMAWETPCASEEAAIISLETMS